MDKTEIQSWVDQGYLHARVIIEVLGRPKEHIEKSLDQYLEKISSSEYIKIIHKDVAPAKEQELPNQKEETKVWSTFAEIEFLIKGISRLVGFCFDYMPSSIEILEPDRIIFNHHTITDFVNDLQAKLHKMDAVLKNLDHENKFLKINSNLMIKNLITISLLHRPLNEEGLSKVTGIPVEGLKPFIENLLNDKRIKKEEEQYSLVQ